MFGVVKTSSLFKPGRAEYERMFPHGVAFDLNQNPTFRAKKSMQILSTLTTGCSHIWMTGERRYMTGLECLALHSIPVTAQLAKLMRCRKVMVDSISHSGCCFLAGNSMHGASVGAIVAIGLMCTCVVE